MIKYRTKSDIPLFKEGLTECVGRKEYLNLADDFMSNPEYVFIRDDEMKPSSDPHLSS